MARAPCRRSRAALLLLLVAALAGGCGGEPRRDPAAAHYVVHAGDTLYSIAWRHSLDYRELARWNGIGSDFRIDVGQVLQLRPGRPAAPRRAAAGAAAAPRPALAPAAVLPVTAPPRWLWPADGPLAGIVHPPSGGVGLRIAGTLGAEVRAAAAGRVVYTGAGLRGYGQLIIIKHDDTWLTAYGYNREVTVAEGELVRAGQRIAAMGAGPGPGAPPLLYFEIRRNGRAVDPSGELPPR